MATSLPKLPKGIDQGGIYNEKAITGDEHGLAAWVNVSRGR